MTARQDISKRKYSLYLIIHTYLLKNIYFPFPFLRLLTDSESLLAQQT